MIKVSSLPLNGSDKLRYIWTCRVDPIYCAIFQGWLGRCPKKHPILYSEASISHPSQTNSQSLEDAQAKVNKKYWKLVLNRCARLICTHSDNTWLLIMWQFDWHFDNLIGILTLSDRSHKIDIDGSRFLTDLDGSWQIWGDLYRSAKISTDLGRSSYNVSYIYYTLIF